VAEILIVDDSSAIRTEVSKYLQSQGISVETAVDGVDGLNKICATKDIKLVLCDVNMPNMDGVTMIEKAREKLAGKPMHFIMLTTESDPRLKARSKSAGVKGWIVKPFNGPAAIQGIKKLIGS